MKMTPRMILGVDTLLGVCSYENNPQRTNFDKYADNWQSVESRTAPLRVASYFVKDEYVHGEYKRYHPSSGEILIHRFYDNGKSVADFIEDGCEELEFKLRLEYGSQWFLKEE